MFNKLEARVLSEYKRSRAAPSTFCTLIKHYFSFIKHYVNNRQAIKPQRPVAVLTQNNIISCSTQYLIINLTIFFMSPIEIFAVYINKMMSF